MVNCINLIIEMSPRFALGRENVPCVAEVVNRLLKADCTDFTDFTEERISVVETILPEFRYYYVDGLHFSHFGLKKVCSIILPNLHKVLAPSKHKKRKSSRSARAKSRS